MKEFKLYLNGNFQDASDKGYYDSINPYDRSFLAKVSAATLQDAKEAIVTARAAFDAASFGGWSAKSREERSNILKQIADKVKENSQKLQELIVGESGSTFNKPKGEV